MTELNKFIKTNQWASMNSSSVSLALLLDAKEFLWQSTFIIALTAGIKYW